MRAFVVFIIGSILVVSQANEIPKVKTPLGGIIGYYKVSENGKRFQAFEGIPYALPPVGKLRFRPPKRIFPWTGDLLATKYGSSCLQYLHVSPKGLVQGSEDCLYLNVYKPSKSVDENSLLPVIIWIHGGYFMYGASNLYGPEYLMDREVILVTINYRVGILGFLSTEDEVVSGNMGLKDQNMAIRWVSENIEWFGGDHKKITLVGLSAGGASVHYHYLSPMSAGLFRSGISLSGNALLSWAQTRGAAEKAKKLGALLGCPTDVNREMIDCLRQQPARSIVQAVEHFLVCYYIPTTPFGPVVEKYGTHTFINRTPANIIKSEHVQDLPWLTGVTSEEGIYPTAEFITDEKPLRELDQNWESMAPHLLDFNYTIPIENHAKVAQTIKRHYLGTKSISRSTVKQLIQMTGDRNFVVDAEKAARMQAKVNKSPVWFYYFNYRGAHSISEFASKSKENFGVSHGDDAMYVLKFQGVNTTSTANDRKMQQDLLDLWTSFTEKREPDLNIEWPPIDPSRKKFKYLRIFGPKQFRMEGNANLGEKSFWNSIPFDENKVEKSKKKFETEN